MIDGSGIEISSASLLHLGARLRMARRPLDRERLVPSRGLDRAAYSAALPDVSADGRKRCARWRSRAPRRRDRLGPHCLRTARVPFSRALPARSRRHLVGRTSGRIRMPRGEVAALPPPADGARRADVLDRATAIRRHECSRARFLSRGPSVGRRDGARRTTEPHVGDPTVDPRDGFACTLVVALPGPDHRVLSDARRAARALASRGDEAAAECAQTAFGARDRSRCSRFRRRSPTPSASPAWSRAGRRWRSRSTPQAGTPRSRRVAMRAQPTSRHSTGAAETRAAAPSRARSTPTAAGVATARPALERARSAAGTALRAPSGGSK